MTYEKPHTNIPVHWEAFYLDEAGINATCLLSDAFTIEDAKEFATFLVNELY